MWINKIKKKKRMTTPPYIFERGYAKDINLNVKKEQYHKVWNHMFYIVIILSRFPFDIPMPFIYIHCTY